MSSHAVDRGLMARVLWRIRRRPADCLARLADEMGVHSRRVGEAIQELRFRGHRILNPGGRGYVLVRSRRDASPTIRAMWSRIAEIRRAAIAMERGRSRQTTARATRRRVAA